MEQASATETHFFAKHKLITVQTLKTDFRQTQINCINACN